METVVGMDVAADELVVAGRGAAGGRRWAHDGPGQAALVAQLRPLTPPLIVLAGTAGLEAAVLAEFAAIGRPARRPRADAAPRAVRAVVARRRQGRDRRVAAPNRRRRAPAIVQPARDRVIASLTAALAPREQAVTAAGHLDPDWAAPATTRRRVPGVGPIVTATVLAELPELGTLGAKPLAALVGVASLTQQRGRHKPPATMGGGRATIRQALDQATVTAVRGNPVLQRFAAQLKAAGQPRKVARIPCPHQLLTIRKAIRRDGTSWHPADQTLDT